MESMSQDDATYAIRYAMYVDGMFDVTTSPPQFEMVRLRRYADMILPR